MNENDRKLLAEVLRCARIIASDGADIDVGYYDDDDIDDISKDARALQSALDRYDLRAEDRIA